MLFRSEHPDKVAQFEQRLAGIPEEHRPYFLNIYANPVRDKLDGLPCA